MSVRKILTFAYSLSDAKNFLKMEKKIAIQFITIMLIYTTIILHIRSFIFSDTSMKVYVLPKLKINYVKRNTFAFVNPKLIYSVTYEPAF